MCFARSRINRLWNCTYIPTFLLKHIKVGFTFMYLYLWMQNVLVCLRRNLRFFHISRCVSPSFTFNKQTNEWINYNWQGETNNCINYFFDFVKKKTNSKITRVWIHIEKTLKLDLSFCEAPTLLNVNTLKHILFKINMMQWDAKVGQYF